MSTTSFGPQTATQSAAAARKTRAQWLVSVASGVVSITDLVHFAATELGLPLRRVTLHTLLTSQPGWGKTKAKAVLDRLCFLADVDNSKGRQELTVGWLLDGRSQVRYPAWAEALSTPPRPPWPGFPFAPAPGGAL